MMFQVLKIRREEPKLKKGRRQKTNDSNVKIHRQQSKTKEKKKQYTEKS